MNAPAMLLPEVENPAPKRRWMRSLRFRLTASFIGVLGIVLFAAWAIGIVAARRALLVDTDTALAVELERFTDERVVQKLSVAETKPQPPLPPIIALIYLRAIDETTGKSFLTAGELSRRPDLVPSLDSLITALKRQSPQKQTDDYAFVVPDDARKMRVLTRFLVVNGHPVYVQAATPWRRTDAVLTRVSLLTAIALLGVLLAAVAVGWRLVSSTLAPIDRIVTEVSRLDPADLPDSLLPPPPETDSEIGRLVETLNRMVTRLRSAFQSQAHYAEAQQRFAADASHELRTPLTILRGEIELALSRPRPLDSYQQTLNVALEEIDHMASIVEGLGLLARHDAGAIAQAEPTRTVDLCAISEDVVESLRPAAIQKGVDVSIDVTGHPKPVNGHGTQLERLVGNLVGNAIKYTPPGGKVAVALDTTSKGQALLTVRDTGLGIAPDDLPHVFDRFWRADRARSTEGTGLGLSICQAIAKSHGGTITVQSAPGLGATFTVTLPEA